MNWAGMPNPLRVKLVVVSRLLFSYAISSRRTEARTVKAVYPNGGFASALGRDSSYDTTEYIVTSWPKRMRVVCRGSRHCRLRQTIGGSGP